MNTTDKWITNAFTEIDKGNMNNAYKHIKSKLDENNPEAQYIYAMYISHENESAEEYDKRSLNYIHLSAKQMYPPALYELGVRFQYGMGVLKDEIQASQLFKHAAELGHGKAKLSYAIDLFLGRNNVSKNETQARLLISECIDSGIEGASQLIEELNGLIDN